ncbi:tail fiber domain-containing protein [Aquimarina longa]|uniref:tail fiber domain-containing protein n=1 Tax=Aquimarina longa TaxID=1080221 RepID=UPI000785B543|nr:tail fiber domain-containing protein [Aquimarina longa]
MSSNTKENRKQLKTFFEAGDRPTEAQFSKLINSVVVQQSDKLFINNQHEIGIGQAPEDSKRLTINGIVKINNGSLITNEGGIKLKGNGNTIDLQPGGISYLNSDKIGIGVENPQKKLHIRVYNEPERSGAAPFMIENSEPNNKWVGMLWRREGKRDWGVYSEDGDFSIWQSDAYNSPSGTYPLIIKENGNIGIGTTEPRETLDVKGKLRVSDNNLVEGATMYYQQADHIKTKYIDRWPDKHERAVIFKPEAYQDVHGAGGAGFQFWTQGIVRGESENYTSGHKQAMVIRKDGKIGIGIANPSAKFHVVGGTTRLETYNTTSNALIIGGLYHSGNNPATKVSFGGDGTRYGAMWWVPGLSKFHFVHSVNDWFGGNGPESNTPAGYSTLVAYTEEPSDRRLKKNIKSLPLLQSEKLNKVQGIEYQLINEEQTKIGFIAQDLMKVYPELVSKGLDGYHTVNYTGLIPVLVEAFKELQLEINKLKNNNKKTNLS